MLRFGAPRPTIRTPIRGEFFVMTTSDRMLPPEKAIDIIIQHIKPISAEDVPLAAAGGRVLAEALVADQDLPSFPAATMDGFAVIADDVSPWREILADQYAGNVEDIEITPGTAARIMTGAPVPRGATAVIRVENTETRDDHVIVHQDQVGEGENIRPIGADLRSGDVLLEPGTTIGPAEIGLLASLGRASVRVARKPRVSIMSTGDELVDPEQEPGPGQIRDSNRFSLAIAAQRAGAEIVWVGRAPDDMAALRRLLRERIDQSDVVITSGGVSMGEKDFVKALLDEVATVHFRRLFMKPGKPFNFATSGDTLIFGLPGNPVSALVGFEVFICTALRALAGVRQPRPRTVTVTLSHDVGSSDRLEYQRGVVWADERGLLYARNTGSQSSARLMSLAGINAFILIQPSETPYRAGAQVPAMILGPIGDRPSV
jgi:molybdenum cofactor synthesis domain-containing protein